MKKEEIDKLVDLNSLIKILNIELQHIHRIQSLKTIWELQVLLDGTHIHPKRVPGLQGVLIDALEDAYESHLKKLRNQLDQLVLCTEVKGGPDYLPINI